MNEKVFPLKLRGRSYAIPPTHLELAYILALKTLPYDSKSYYRSPEGHKDRVEAPMSMT